MTEPTRFSYQAHKDDRVTIYDNHRPVTNLKGKAAVKFLNQVTHASEEQCQMAMAKVTGNYKRGNERSS